MFYNETKLISKCIFCFHENYTENTITYNDCLHSSVPNCDCVKSVQISVFSPNTGKYGPEKTPYLDTFHAVCREWC